MDQCSPRALTGICHRSGPCPAVIPQVTGMAYRTGEHTFVVDPADSLVPGFVLR